MMDFLRRLAPPRETDGTRAVAVLPSPFAANGPLRNAGGPVESRARLGDDDPALALDTDAGLTPGDSGSDIGSMSAAFAAGDRGSDGRSGRTRHRAAAIARAMSVARAAADEADRRDRASELEPADAAADALGVLHSRQRREATAADRDEQAQRGLTSRAAPASAPHLLSASTRASMAGARDVGVDGASGRHIGGSARRRAAPPLSQSTVEQRAISRQDADVVHVTIGRIDVVAQAAPAPASRRTPAPRQPTLTLPEYLRGSNGRGR
ncbi:MAG: hypothetical protein ABI652_04100 [Acidobacteriota bacterium]